MKAWSGRAVERARKVVVTWLPAECGQCSKPVDVSEPWVVGHKAPRWLRPDLTFVVDNWQPEHRRCSEETSAREAALKAEYLRTGTWPAKYAEYEEAGLFPIDSTFAEANLPPSLSPEDSLFPIPDTWGPVTVKPTPFPTNGGLIEPRDELLWNTERVRTYAWLADLADVPEDAAPPYAMTYPPADAVCSYGWSGCTHLPEGVSPAVEWVEEQAIRGVRSLRWWQRLATIRQLEHREDGTLCVDSIVESTPRRAGKSVRIRSIALWRMTFGAAVFGEIQTIVHTGSDVAICREIQRAAWGWAMARWGKEAVRKGNGKEELASTNDDRWLVKAQDAVYGYDVCLGLGDECWDVKPDTVTEGLEPASLERSSPQIYLTSTAHRRATSLMKTALTDALTLGDPTVLLLLWASPSDVDSGDPAGWRAASPFWSEAREKYIAKKYAKALAGEVDPEADDPDPMKGFESQYLNRWSLRTRKIARGVPLLEEPEWDALGWARPATVPIAAAIEGWSGGGYSVALAWRVGERCIVQVVEHAELSSAAAAVRASKYRGVVPIGDHLDKDPAVKTLRRKKNTGTASAAAAEIARLLKDDTLRHVPEKHLTGQVLDARTVDGADGKRLVSTGRADALKAAAWAVAVASSKPAGGGVTGLVLPSSA